MAYYTKSINIKTGPYKFNGLPGLILEVYERKIVMLIYGRQQKWSPCQLVFQVW